MSEGTVSGQRARLLDLARQGLRQEHGGEGLDVVGATIEAVTPEMVFEDQGEPLAPGWWLLRVTCASADGADLVQVEFLVRAKKGASPLSLNAGKVGILPCWTRAWLLSSCSASL